MATYRKVDWDNLNEEEKQDWAETIGFQQHVLMLVADKIKEGVNVSPKLVAKSLRGLYDIGIPEEILNFIAEYLDGKKRQGGPEVTNIFGSKSEIINSFIAASVQDIMTGRYNKYENTSSDVIPIMTKEKAIERYVLMQLGVDPDDEEQSLMVDTDELATKAKRIKRKCYPEKKKSKKKSKTN